MSEIKFDDTVDITDVVCPVTKGWRVILRVKVKDPKKTTDMRAALVNTDQTLSETWSYQLPANE